MLPPRAWYAHSPACKACEHLTELWIGLAQSRIIPPYFGGITFKLHLVSLFNFQFYNDVYTTGKKNLEGLLIHATINLYSF